MGRFQDQLCKNCWVCHKLAIPCPTTWWENILALKSCKVLPLYWVNYQKLDFHNGNALQNTNHIFVYERFLIFLYEILKNIKVSAAHLLIHMELLSCGSLSCVGEASLHCLTLNKWIWNGHKKYVIKCNLYFI